MTQTPGFSILPITEEDTSRVLDFLRKFFFQDEPMVDDLKIMDGPDSRCPELEEFSVHSIPEGVSIMAVNASGEIVGVSLNGLLTRDKHSLEPPESEHQLELEKYTNLKFRKIAKILDFVYWASNPFKSHPDVDAVFEIKIVSVDSACRRQGLAQALVRRSIEIAREKRTPLIRVDCSSAFSAMVVEKLGFWRVYTLPFTDYKDPDGHPMVTPKPPHSGISSFLYNVEESGH